MSDPIIALDSDKVARLTCISKATLASWERQGIITPSYVDPQENIPFRKIYSFRDVVSLRALAKIRKDLNVPLSEIRKAAAYLTKYSESPWSELRFGVLQRKLVFRDPETQKWVGVSGQSVLELDLDGVPQEVELGIPEVLKRDASTHGVVTKNRFVRHNQPVIAGTRIPVTTIWNFHEAGVTVAGILDEYPQLTEADVTAAIEYERKRLEEHDAKKRKAA